MATQQQEDTDVCCVLCQEFVCKFNEDPKHKDTRDEAICDECFCDYYATDYDTDEEEDCVCGNNYKKGLVNDEMRCEDCDVDGKNYEGGLTDEEDFCWEVNCDKCGKICDKNECPFDTGYDENEKFICDNCGEDDSS